MLGSASQNQADAGGKYGIAQKENRLVEKYQQLVCFIFQ